MNDDLEFFETLDKKELSSFLKAISNAIDEETKNKRKDNKNEG